MQLFFLCPQGAKKLFFFGDRILYFSKVSTTSTYCGIKRLFICSIPQTYTVHYNIHTDTGNHTAGYSKRKVFLNPERGK
jgi:hypothetical protein